MSDSRKSKPEASKKTQAAIKRAVEKLEARLDQSKEHAKQSGSSGRPKLRPSWGA